MKGKNIPYPFQQFFSLLKPQKYAEFWSEKYEKKINIITNAVQIFPQTPLSFEMYKIGCVYSTRVLIFFLIASKIGLIFYHKGKQHARVWSRVQSLVPYT